MTHQTDLAFAYAYAPERWRSLLGKLDEQLPEYERRLDALVEDGIVTREQADERLHRRLELRKLVKRMAGGTT
jgi:hypothetical protein